MVSRLGFSQSRDGDVSLYLLAHQNADTIIDLHQYDLNTEAGIAACEEEIARFAWM